jgi:hypothetical protein
MPPLPPTKTLTTLPPAHFTLNPTLSTDFTRILKIQGVNTLIRNLASSTTPHLLITHLSPNKVIMKQTAMSSKLPGTEEEYPLDWTWREDENGLFGKVEGRARWIGVEEATSGEEGGVLGDGEHVEWAWGGGEEERLLQAEGRDAEGKWEARHLLGFEVLKGERRFTRRVCVRNEGGEEVRGVMVWDWVGEE